MSEPKPGQVMAKILIMAKTYPTPSERHTETVCVAGVRLDTSEPEWVRIYPMPFRTLERDHQFKKYQIVEVPIEPRGPYDPRPESFKPDWQAMTLGDVVDSQRGKWSRRREMVGRLVGETTACELLRANRATPMNRPAPSLGLVKPRQIRLTISDGKGFTQRQQAKAIAAASPTLFDLDSKVYNELEPAPYEIKAHYKCMDPDCKGHKQTIIDWEVGSAAINWRRRYPESEIPARLLEKWESMFADDKDSHLFIGNQHQHRHSFLVLGVWYPTIARR